MDKFLSQLVIDLELKNFGITYEDLVPVTCTLEWVSYNDKVKNKLIVGVMNVLFPGGGKKHGMTPKETLTIQLKIKGVADSYWNDIVEETKVFKTPIVNFY